ncbi:hypothetical protein UK23_22120 [Lentzea aerocolonigenes]|uniref:Uncharacterized protein n=1 Tax=Lentzea aerocolonigenes TaxID=68170 RepID=A0A0F0GU77_LENAE|nr:hypothetical protein [Lentzea aerocolonigenes]KJK46860.1 hypothetical protein UK23_22120 [Lentzea aerocolonigenes]
MSTPYLRQGNVYIVPVLRHHLNFSVQVQRAMRELRLDEQDVIAVGLPESLHAPMLQAVARLPRVSLLISRLSDGDQREVFPVTPADGMTEAVRIAAEHGIPLRFVDQEIAPGHLLDRFCMADEDWPDDGLALEHGARWYLDLVAERLVHPPSRFEPMDTWRELHMAALLRRMHPRYRRVLFVCNATHVHAVQRLLRQPELFTDDVRPALPGMRYEIRDPSLHILMRYLDYIPRLVERYEAARAEGTAPDFDKRTALLRLVYQLSVDAKDLRLSLRHYQVFSQVLTKLLEEEKRISPMFETVMTASTGCFGKLFTERLFRDLLGYFDQVKIERIGRIRGTRESLFEVAVTKPRSRGGPVFVARNCTQFEHYYEVIGATARKDDDPDSAPDLPPGEIIDLEGLPPRWQGRPPERKRHGWERSSWPPADLFIEAMREKVFDLVNRGGDHEVRSTEFRGSMHEGLDFRRTLRSYYKKEPKLYVRQTRAVRRLVVDRAEPVLWLSDRYESADLNDDRYMFSYAYSGAAAERLVDTWYLGRSQTTPADLKNSHSEPVEITAYELYARVSFRGSSGTLEEIRDRFGDSLYARVPSEEAVADVDLLRQRVSSAYGLQLDWTRWWEIMILTALEYAKEAIVLIAPQQFVVPAEIASSAAARGKSITRVSPARFTREELRRFSTEYYLETRYPGKRPDYNDPVHREYLVERFSDVMKRFWE